MRNCIFSFFFVLGISGCTAQDDNKALPDAATADSVATVEKPEPKVSWKVNKETDEYGNIIRYDSIYSWSYATGDGELRNIDVDSLMRSFSGFMNERMPGMWEDRIWSPFQRDSLWREDFWSDDFFHNRWKREFYDMDYMFRRMDSLRNKFLRDEFPDWDDNSIPRKKI